MNRKMGSLYLICTLLPTSLGFVAGLQFGDNPTVGVVTLVLLAALYAMLTSADTEASKVGE